ncbi:hypothetical protein NQ314_012754 [Rhamnusium bicolor]|uniref:Uncharacterized protein n=1 Tax=Rhamnusium bicolor TaxID=1586634 RepID=A0AAV8XBZ9_9CUCU|nr:hypothetical protein NQ314_012754 [Rhamnusium bicolor]
MADFCYFCETKVHNFSRHLRRCHPCEAEVQNIFSLNSKDPVRRQLLASVRKKGNFIVNFGECIKPMKKTMVPERNHLPCTNCLGFYSAKFLWRHRKKCLGKNSTNPQSDSQTLLLGKNNINSRVREEVFPRMRADLISLEAKKGQTYLCFCGEIPDNSSGKTFCKCRVQKNEGTCSNFN